MARFVLVSLMALGLAACGGPGDESWEEGQQPITTHPELDASPAQRLLLLLIGGFERCSSPDPMPGILRESQKGESSPDPMPGRPREPAAGSQ